MSPFRKFYGYFTIFLLQEYYKQKNSQKLDILGKKGDILRLFSQGERPMPGPHTISVPLNPIGQSHGQVLGASAQPKSLHKATIIYTHVLNRGGKGIKSPVDEL
jgi:hypothetical protein